MTQEELLAKHKEFEAIVREMREAQKNYFKHRSPGWLQKSKELERKVDNWKPLKTEQKSLF